MVNSSVTSSFFVDHPSRPVFSIVPLYSGSFNHMLRFWLSLPSEGNKKLESHLYSAGSMTGRNGFLTSIHKYELETKYGRSKANFVLNRCEQTTPGNHFRSGCFQDKGTTSESQPKTKPSAVSFLTWIRFLKSKITTTAR